MLRQAHPAAEARHVAQARPDPARTRGDGARRQGRLKASYSFFLTHRDKARIKLVARSRKISQSAVVGNLAGTGFEAEFPGMTFAQAMALVGERERAAEDDEDDDLDS